MNNKQLIEAAKTYANIPLDRNVSYFNDAVREYYAFIYGAEWAADKLYTEEEVYKILDRAFHMYASHYRQQAKEFFTQNKK